MKPREFLKKYNLEGKKWDPKKQDAFISDMKIEFDKFAQEFNAEYSKAGLINAVNHVRTKWNAISNKVSYGLPDGLWSFFYATVIAPVKEVCGAQK